MPFPGIAHLGCFNQKLSEASLFSRLQVLVLSLLIMPDCTLRRYKLSFWGSPITVVCLISSVPDSADMPMDTGTSSELIIRLFLNPKVPWQCTFFFSFFESFCFLVVLCLQLQRGDLGEIGRSTLAGQRKSYLYLIFKRNKQIIGMLIPTINPISNFLGYCIFSLGSIFLHLSYILCRGM